MRTAWGEVVNAKYGEHAAGELDKQQGLDDILMTVLPEGHASAVVLHPIFHKLLGCDAVVFDTAEQSRRFLEISPRTLNLPTTFSTTAVFDGVAKLVTHPCPCTPTCFGQMCTTRVSLGEYFMVVVNNAMDLGDRQVMDPRLYRPDYVYQPTWPLTDDTLPLYGLCFLGMYHGQGTCGHYYCVTHDREGGWTIKNDRLTHAVPAAAIRWDKVVLAVYRRLPASTLEVWKNFTYPFPLLFTRKPTPVVHVDQTSTTWPVGKRIARGPC
jgi:hypothetical protein